MKKLIKQPYIEASARNIKPKRYLKLKDETDCYKCKFFEVTDKCIKNTIDWEIRCKKMPYYVLNDHIHLLNYLGCKSFEVLK